MEPANEKNNYSHIAHKLKRLLMKFEDSNGTYITLQWHTALK